MTRPLVAFLAPFIMYTLTLAPTISNLDSAELTTVAATLGITRSTGYPLYTLLGHLWTKIPVGDVGFRMNLFSAFFGALTIFTADRVLARWRIGGIASLGGLGLLASAPYFWGLSLVAEVYTLHTALMAGILLALQHWIEYPGRAQLMALAAMVGLSLAHHAAAVLLIPGLLVFLLTGSRRNQLFSRNLFPAIGTGLLALSLYAYLPLRITAMPAVNFAGFYDTNAVFHPIALNTWQGFWWLLSGQSFHNQMFAYSADGLSHQLAWFGNELVRAFFAIGIGPGLVGWAVLWQRNRKIGVLLSLWFLCSAGFYLNYRVADKAMMFLPCYLVWGIAAAFGFQALIRWLQTDAEPGQNYASIGLRLAIIAAVITAFAWNWPLVDQSDQWNVRQQAEARLIPLEHNAVLIGYWDTVPAIQYLQFVEGARTDVAVINRFLVPAEQFPALVANTAADRPVYIDSPSADLPAGFRLVKDRDLYRVVSNSSTAQGERSNETVP